MNILNSAFTNWPTEMFSILNSSVEIATNILVNLNIMAVENFCTSIVTKYSSSQSFVWFAYKALMGVYGPGGPAPAIIASEKIVNGKIPSIMSQQRLIIIKLMILFFNKFSHESLEFSRTVSLALPVMMQKAINDVERALVFELAIELRKNDAISKCAMSVIFSNCKDLRLIELSFHYLTKFPPRFSADDVELIIFDVLHRRNNEFIIVAFLSFFRQQITLMEITKTFVERVRNIVIHSMRNQSSTLLLRSVRVDIVNAINGKSTLSNIDDFTKDINKQRNNSCSSTYDKDRIRYLKIQLSNNTSKSPTFDATALWGSKAAINEVFFYGLPHSKKSFNGTLMGPLRKADAFAESNFSNKSLDSDDYLSGEANENYLINLASARVKGKSPAFTRSTSLLTNADDTKHNTLTPVRRTNINQTRINKRINSVDISSRLPPPENLHDIYRKPPSEFEDIKHTNCKNSNKSAKPNNKNTNNSTNNAANSNTSSNSNTNKIPNNNKNSNSESIAYNFSGNNNGKNMAISSNSGNILIDKPPLPKNSTNPPKPSSKPRRKGSLSGFSLIDSHSKSSANLLKKTKIDKNSIRDNSKPEEPISLASARQKSAPKMSLRINSQPPPKNMFLQASTRK
ncbi:hypothetical protein TRFO_12318 [Tritrichomonas foetus]|uniref:Uncharacterized protein n=1 Tax=Tritrichomonas foetus TaxID=1144522 RepID=A0A1J4J003_9EUKA|nr:hypothetical protein TRFO_12318 [Tritrichomonas foetus]|eukprot:OHS92762.1 hypothetical protein TRFO_12318 [Tritrichomonas foetus]